MMNQETQENPKTTDEIVVLGPSLDEFVTLVNKPREAKETVTGWITPEIATWSLENNFDKNRPFRPSSIEKFASDMSRPDGWVETHQGVAYTDTGKLYDGQNRMRACILAGVPFKTDITFGLKEDTFINVDSGRSRSVADHMKAIGIPISAEKNHAIRLIVEIDRGNVDERSMRKAGANMSPAEIRDWYEANADLFLKVDSVARLSSKARPLVKAGFLAGLYLVGREPGIDWPTFERFATQVRDGVGFMDKDDVAAALYRNIVANSVQGLVLAAHVVKTWNSTTGGKVLKLVKWSTSERFPKVAVA